MMANTIDAETAKLAGLQVDLLQKVRQGKITLQQLEEFLDLSKNVEISRFIFVDENRKQMASALLRMSRGFSS